MNPILIYELEIMDDENGLNGDKPIKPLRFITEVPVTGGVDPAPATISFFYAKHQSSIYKIYVSQDATIKSTTKWDSCILILEENGVVNNSSTCSGATKTASSTTSVANIAFGTSFASKADTPPTGYMDFLYNPIPLRFVTFKNKTGYDKICLNLQSKFNKDSCTGTGDIVIKNNDEYIHQVSPGGNISYAGFITGYYSKANGWHYSGRMTTDKVGVYVTTMEWTMFPESPLGTPPPGYTDHSVGITNIDLSAVNGFNFAGTLSVDSPTVCSTATRNSDGEANPAKFKLYSGTIAALPTSDVVLSNKCPSDSVVKDGTETKGCLSPCKYAIRHSLPHQDVICCSGSYSNSEKCTAKKFTWNGGSKKITHSELPYVQNLASPVTEHVYRWQFDDYAGDFSCQPGASFTYTILSPNSAY